MSPRVAAYRIVTLDIPPRASVLFPRSILGKAVEAFFKELREDGIQVEDLPGGE